MEDKILSSAYEYLENEAAGADINRLLELFAMNSNLWSVAVDGDNERECKRLCAIVEGLEHMITNHVMREHGYYQTDTTGYSRWEKE